MITLAHFSHQSAVRFTDIFDFIGGAKPVFHTNMAVFIMYLNKSALLPLV